MDTSEKYIKMCRETKEIQSLIWEAKAIKAGDYFSVETFHKAHIFLFPCTAEIFYEEEDKLWLVNGSLGKAISGRSEIANALLVGTCGQDIPLFSIWVDNFYKYDDGELNFIWLPRQDQLQKMVEPSGLSDSLLYCFWNFLTHDNGEYALNSYARSFYSFEQLWLAFVEGDKYKKIWDKKKENWVCQQ